MYNPKSFQCNEPGPLHDFIRSHPLGLLVSAVEGSIQADLAPFYLDAGRRVLRAHLSRANPQWSQLAQAGRALVVFQGPQTYVTPSWYATKQLDGKVVPTWNYTTVQVEGTARVFQDADWLLEHVREMTDFFEQHRAEPWSLSDAPEAFIQGQLKGIVGVEIALERLQGKRKMSQNRSAEDRTGVASGLLAMGRADLAGMVCPKSVLPADDCGPGRPSGEVG